jgi:hypothetical protein
MNASSNVSQLDALHLELLHAAIPQQYDTIGVMMPGVAGRIGCRASAYRSAAKRLCRSGAENVESLLAAFLSDAQCRRTQGRGYVQEVLWTVMLAASQVEGIPFAKRLEWLDKLAQCADNWASCDLLGEAVKDFTLPQNEASAFAFLDALIKSRNLWRIRLALVLMLAHMAPAGSRPLKRAVQLSSAPEVLTCAAQSYYGSMGPGHSPSTPFMTSVLRSGSSRTSLSTNVSIPRQLGGRHRKFASPFARLRQKKQCCRRIFRKRSTACRQAVCLPPGTASPLAAYRHFEGSASKARLRVPLYNL